MLLLGLLLGLLVGLLDRTYLLGLGHSLVPRLEERRAAQLGQLFAAGWDVLTLREL